MDLQGWQPDPFQRFEERYFSPGQPTKLARTGPREFYDPVPPDASDAWQDPQPTEARQRNAPGWQAETPAASIAAPAAAAVMAPPAPPSAPPPAPPVPDEDAFKRPTPAPVAPVAAPVAPEPVPAPEPEAPKPVVAAEDSGEPGSRSIAAFLAEAQVDLEPLEPDAEPVAEVANPETVRSSAGDAVPPPAAPPPASSEQAAMAEKTVTAGPRKGRRIWASSLAGTRPRPVVAPPPSEPEPAPAPAPAPVTAPAPAPVAAPTPEPGAAGPEPVATTLEPEPGAEPEQDKPDSPRTPPPADRPPSPPAPLSARPSGKRTDGSRPARAPSRRRKVALGVLLVLIGLLVLPVAGMLLIHVSNVQRQFSQLRADGVHAEGTLVNGGPGSRNQITFTDRGGRVITRAMPAPNGDDVLPDGKVDVVYVPVNPANASLAHLVAQSDHVDAALLVGSGLGAVAGLALIFWGVVLLTGSRQPIADAPEAGSARATSPA